MLRPSRPYPAGRRDVHSLSSLDHCAWFHQPADLSDWLLFAKAPAAIGGPRGLVTGRIYGRDGTLVATVTQEALLAVPAPGGQRN
jgi:acyl-CoA thioesterase-2